jgi:hypothetical protein
MPQLGQWLWALPFLKVVGPTHVALRLSTIVLSWLGLLGLYDLFLSEGVPAGRSAFATVTLALNPLFYLCQGTFMTDVPSLSFALGALALYTRAIRGERWPLLWAATAVAIVAAITRQNAVVVSAVAAILLVRSPHLRGRFTWIIAIIAPAIAAVAAHLWFEQRTDIIKAEFTPQPPHLIALLPYLALHTCGLAVLPALALAPPLRSWKWCMAGLIFMLASAGYWAHYHDFVPSFDLGPLFPYTIPMISPWGPFAGHFQVGNGEVLLSIPMRAALTLAGCIGGAGLLARLAEWAQTGPHRPGPIMLFCSIQGFLILVAPSLYDRYLLVLFPAALLLAIAPTPRTQATFVPAMAILAVAGVLAVCLMHDWLSWNSARWALGRKAVSEGTREWQIEGGFEWNGWHAPQPRPPRPRFPREHRLRLIYTDNNFWWVTGDYALAFSQQPASIILKSRAYSLWLNSGQHEFLLLKYQAQGNSR